MRAAFPPLVVQSPCRPPPPSQPPPLYSSPDRDSLHVYNFTRILNMSRSIVHSVLLCCFPFAVSSWLFCCRSFLPRLSSGAHVAPDARSVRLIPMYLLPWFPMRTRDQQPAWCHLPPLVPVTCRWACDYWCYCMYWCDYWCHALRTLCDYMHARASPQLRWSQHSRLLKCEVHPTGTATVSTADCPAVWPGDASLHCALRP